MSETAPRQPTPRFGAQPFDYESGQPLSDAQYGRIMKIELAYRALLDAMHEADGTPDAPNFGSRRMAIANTQIEMGILMAKRACLEAK